jgi:hypothetical protein
MVVVLPLLYAVACALIAVHGFIVLRHMTRRTPHLRRSAFILLTMGGFIGCLEALDAMVPTASLVVLTVGALLLLIAGPRWRFADRQHHKPGTMQ